MIAHHDLLTIALLTDEMRMRYLVELLGHDQFEDKEREFKIKSEKVQKQSGGFAESSDRARANHAYRPREIKKSKIPYGETLRTLFFFRNERYCTNHAIG